MAEATQFALHLAMTLATRAFSAGPMKSVQYLSAAASHVLTERPRRTPVASAAALRSEVLAEGRRC
jgi:hypothetical protein